MPDREVGRTVIITGASRGLGKEIALAFGRTRSRVVVNCLIRREAAEAVAAEIHRSGGEALCVRADVRREADVEAMIAETMSRWGRVDVLVNNAGVTKDGLLVRMSEHDWDDVLDANLKAAFLCIRAVSRVMMKQKSGHIINIASITGVQGREGQANYSASKAGLIGLTKAAARELGMSNIRVNAVLPGYLPTDMGREVSEAVIDRVKRDNCLGRISDPREAAEFIVHLSGMQNVSGQVFNLDSRIL